MPNSNNNNNKKLRPWQRYSLKNHRAVFFFFVLRAQQAQKTGCGTEDVENSRSFSPTNLSTPNKTKQKVKLTPGKQKRGKASKQAIEVFSRARDTPASHKPLMKGVTVNECVAAMIGDVKVSVAGLAQANQVRFLVT